MGKNNRRRNNNRDDISKGDASTTSSVGDSRSAGARRKVEKTAASSSLLTLPTVEQKQPVRNTNTNAGGVTRRSFYQWCARERQGVVWVLGCVLLGSIFGYGLGSGVLIGEEGKSPSTWRINLGGKIRSNIVYRNTIGKIPRSSGRNTFLSENKSIKTIVGIASNVVNSIPLFGRTNDAFNGTDPFSNHGIPSVVVKKIHPDEMKSNPSHPYVYAILREAIAREKGGYVHPDLGFMEPAPCGAARGIGMVRNVYHRCQTRCVPGTADDKLKAKRKRENHAAESTTEDEGEGEGRRYLQEEVLIRVPLSYQMTRKVALDTLMPLLTSETQRKTVHELDDAALLVLLLAHERGVGQYSRWLPYITSLPHEPSCGYSQNLRPHLLDTINVLRDELGMDVDGWPGELIRATEYSERIVVNLTNDYGSFLKHPSGISQKANIRWALCHVASRATGGYRKYGALRMIPMIDMLNHDAHAGGFVELTGEERLEKGDFVDTISEEVDGGTFVVRSLRHGRRKALRMGQELMVNYNVPHYSALDWLVSSGFVPPERFQNWQKLDAPLPRIRRDGPFAGIHDTSGNRRNNNAANSRQESGLFRFATAT